VSAIGIAHLAVIMSAVYISVLITQCYVSAVLLRRILQPSTWSVSFASVLSFRLCCVQLFVSFYATFCYFSLSLQSLLYMLWFRPVFIYFYSWSASLLVMITDCLTSPLYYITIISRPIRRNYSPVVVI